MVEVVRRHEQQIDFAGGERTFGWMVRWRRLGSDYDQHTDASEAMIQVATGSLPLCRIGHPCIVKPAPTDREPGSLMEFLAHHWRWRKDGPSFAAEVGDLSSKSIYEPEMQKCLCPAGKQASR